MDDPLVCTWKGWTGRLDGKGSGHPAADGTPPFRAVLGWKGLVVWDPELDPVDLLRAYLEKVRDESCGQCTPCREGTVRLCAIMDRICNGEGRLGDLEDIGAMARFISDTARCDVGLFVAPPTLEMLQRYRGVFEATIRDRRVVARGNYKATVTAPCMSACPSNVDVPAYVEAIRLNRLDEGLAIVRRDCPMPGTIGRVCVRPCEANCRRALVDAPISIRALKRYLADHEIRTGATPKLEAAPPREDRVAVVGAGPAGLSCAFYLGQRGYRTTIFEAQEKAGGMASFGIPSYRLPRDIIAYEVSLVEQLGAEIRYGVRVGEDISVEELGQQGYRAVFLGVGAPESSKMRCEGEDAGYEGFVTGVHFLAEAARGRRPIEGEKLVVVGGGNVAMDCVRSALRIGFKDVNLLYRRTEAEMPADPQEIHEAKEEGVQFHYLVAPVRIVEEGGRVRGLECQRMTLGEPDKSGRRRPVPVEGSEFVIQCDAVVPAVGQVCAVDCVLPEAEALTPWKTLVVDRMTFRSHKPTVFGGGDCVTGPSTLIAALAAGKKAAYHIAQYIEAGNVQPTVSEVLKAIVNQSGVLDRNETWPFHDVTKRFDPPVVDPEVRKTNFEEVEGCLNQAQATAEAYRCLRCYRIAVAAL
jgi:formate dehydrogenase beta subunit